jgi:uncharacterized HAD superfamily protein
VESFVRWRAWEIAGITKDEFFRALDEAWFSWETLPPTEEELDTKVGKLQRFGTVDIVTGRSSETVSQANSWLEHQRIPFDSFVRTGNSTTAKLNLLYDVYIDDSAELMALLASRLHGSGILYLRPWNRDAPEMPRISKVDQWNLVPHAIEQSAATDIT